MSKFTKEIRQQIVREFAVRHNGSFNPNLFLAEVKRIGRTHPAFEWFTWDEKTAALAHQLDEARNFARDLRITFRVEEVHSLHSVRIREAPMPMVLSPLQNRSKGGGYVLVSPDDPEHIYEHCRQAAATLAQWCKRYEAALNHAGINVLSVQSLIGKLEHAQSTKKVG